jgi:O-antigen/teichoic acid export membrane protein
MTYKSRKIFNNTAFMTGSSILSRAIAYLYFLIIIRAFSTTEIGIYAILITSYLLMELAGNLGLDKIMIRDLAKPMEGSSGGVLLYSVLCMKSASSITVWGICLAAFMIFFPVQFGKYRIEFILFFASIVPLCLARSLESYFTAREKMYIPAVSQLLERFFLLAAAWVVYAGFIHFRGFLIAFFISVCGRALLLTIFFPWRSSDITPEFSADKVKSLSLEAMRMLPVEAMA